MKQDHKGMREEDISPKFGLKFVSLQISNVKIITVLSVIYHDKMHTMEQASTIFLMSIFI